MTPLKLGFCLFLLVSPIYATWDELSVHWGLLGSVSKALQRAYYTIPTNSSDASSQGWTQVDSDSDYFTIWCYADDARICALYDLQGYIAGMDVGFPPSDIASEVYDTSAHAIFENVTRLNTTITKTRFFVVSQDVLQSGGRSNITEGIGTGMWLKVGDSIEEIPKTAAEISSETLFTNQSCVATMGKHHFYNMSSTMECAKLEPYFLLTDHSTGELIGAGCQIFGKASKTGKIGFEDTPALGVMAVVSDRPDCLTEWTSEYGVMTLHIFFKSSPWSNGC